MNKSGVSLVELLIVVVMLCSTAAMISLMFPRATASQAKTRHRQMAANFASSGMEKIKQQPYALISLSSGTVFGASAAAATCNCSHPALDMSTLPTEASMTDSSITYARKVCVHLLDGTNGNWTSTCPDTPLTPDKDKGMKHIRVSVVWKQGSNTYSTEITSMVSR